MFALPIAFDGTDRMTRSGVILLDLSEVEGAPAAAIVEFRAPTASTGRRGFRGST